MRFPPPSWLSSLVLFSSLLAILPATTFAQNSTITGCVFVDDDGNGQLDGAETNGVVGGTLNMQLRLVSNNSQVGSNVTVPVGGCFTFNNVNAGTYYLRTNSLKGLTSFYQNLAGRRWLTLKDVGADATDSDFDAGFHQSFVRFEGETDDFVLDGNNSIDLDLGIYISPWLGDGVFRDTSADGIQDAAEEGVPGILVSVYDANTSALLFETETNNDGRYQVGEFSSNASLGDLSPGSRRIEFEVPSGWAASPKDQTTDDLDSDIDASGATDALVLVSGFGGPRQAFPDYDAGLLRSCTVAAGAISGRVYQDTNSDGIWQPSERTYAGTTVTAYDAANGVAASGTTLADGTYSLSVADGTAVRLEFTTLAGASETGPAGAESGTTVQFLSSPSCSADLAINRAQDYCQRDPRPVTGCFVRTTGNQGLGAIVSVPWTIGYEEPPYLQNALHEYPAAATQVGSVLGLAYHRLSNTLFAGSYLRAESTVGPAGEGAIYAMDLNNPVQATRVWTLVDLNSVPALGPGFSGPGLAGQNIPVGSGNLSNAGIGDLDLNASETTLYAINMEPSNSVLVEIPLLGTTTIAADPANIATYAVPNDCSVAGDVRPAAIGFNDVPGDDRVFVGSVCSGASGASAIFEANVYAYDPTNMAAPPVRVLNFPLDYPRTNGMTFRRWSSTSSPLMADLEFDNGDMILNLRLRRGDLNFQVASPDPGDMLRACHAAGTWTLESNGSCGGKTTLGAGTGEGPGGGEYYWGDQDAVKIDEQIVGGLATSPGFPYLVTTVIDAYRLQANGFKWFSNRTGSTAYAYDIYAGGIDLLGKSTGTGDVELLCDPAPIEIGNRIWMDDGNGRQDPGEMAISGVVVNLLDSLGNVLATATTNANGEYYFIGDDSPRAGSGAGHIGEVVGGIGFATDYVVQVADSNFNPGNPLAGKTRSPADYSADSGNTDSHDSDGVDVTIGPSTFTGKSFTTGGPGSNDHRFDFGFGGPPPASYDLALTKVYTSDDYGTTNDGVVGPGGKVTFTITVINQGTTAANNVQVTDYVPAGFRFLTADNSGWVGADGATTPTTTITGPIAPNGGTAPVTVTLTVLSSVTAGTSVNYAEISGDDGNDADSTPDQTNGNDAGGSAGTPSDDAVGGDGSGTPGDGNAAGDQDDHDPASVTVEKYDLALRKQYTSDNSATGTSTDGVVQPGDEVTFTVTLFNQGTVVANNIQLVDFVDQTMWDAFAPGDNPGGTTGGGVALPYSWATSGTDGVVTITGAIPAGQSLTVPVTLTVRATASGRVDNYAEILTDDGIDFDSQPEGDEADRNGDPLVDDEINDDGTTDEDDHDTASASTINYDLAVRKTVTTMPPVSPSERVDFLIELINQGTENANNIELIDTINPAMWQGFDSSINPSGATGGGVSLPYAFVPQGANVRILITGTIPAGQTVTVPISLRVAAGATGNLENHVEVQVDDGDDVDSEPEGDEGDGTNDPLVDDEVDPNPGDEDDHDIAVVASETLSLGNRVWLDSGAGAGTLGNGMIDPGESGVPGVLVELLDASGNPVDLGAGPITAITDGGGYYLFDGLPPGMYRVRVVASNFIAGMPLANLVSSTVTEAMPNSDGDSNDNGIDEYDLVTFGVTSGVVDLTRGGEPQTEIDLGGAGAGSAADDDSNLTVDFGFIPPLSLGNVVFNDLDNSGQQDPGELGIGGVVMTLCDGAGNPILGPDDQPLTTTTDANGFYLFDGLLPGTYIVKIDATSFQSGGPLFEGVSSSGPFEETDPNSDGDLNDNGIDDADPASNGIQSNPVVVDYGVEPSGESGSSGNALDPDSNVTVDFGIVLPNGGLYTIPTLGQWGLLLMVLLLMAAALPRLRRLTVPVK